MNSGSSTTGGSTVLVCSEDPQANTIMENVFSSLVSYQLKKCTRKELANGEGIDPETLDIAILDVGDGTILEDPEFLKIRSKLGELSIIFISAELSQKIRQLIKLDGADWLTKPLQKRVLTDTVNAISQRQKPGANKVHAVLSCGGGSGGSCVAIMLAYYLSRRRKRTQPTAALFDLDFSKADIGAYLNVENEYKLESVNGKSERVDLEFINVIKKMHDSGFTLFSFDSPHLTYSETGVELVLRMLDLVSYQHDHTVLDLSSYMTPWQPTIISAVDTVTIVSGTSLPSLQRAKQKFKEISTLRKSEKGIHVVANRMKRGLLGSQFGKKELGKLFDISTLTILPDEQNLMLEALNRGMLPIEVNKRSTFCSRLHDLSEIIVHEVR